MEKNKEKKIKRTIGIIAGILLTAGILFSILLYSGSIFASAVPGNTTTGNGNQALSANTGNIHANAASQSNIPRITNAQRKTAAAARGSPLAPSLIVGPNGLQIPDYFGVVPNYANSPLPSVNSLGGFTGGGIKKFIDSLPGLSADGGLTGKNDLGQYIPIAVADNTTFNGSDYYEIGLIQYTEKLHANLPSTTLRGYVQLSTAKVPGKRIGLTYPNGSIIKNAGGGQVLAVDNPQYLGPIIIANKGIPVRVKFTNYLPTGTNGNLFIPVDTTVMGAGPYTVNFNGPTISGNFVQNRATMHLHGGNTPWISDGTEHQWITPAGENTSYPKGVSVAYVPDMWFNNATGAVFNSSGSGHSSNMPESGSQTFYYTNQQSARLMFYHDHAYGITRLNVYAGEAAGYLETDQVEQDLIKGTNNSGANILNTKVLPDAGIPLVIQDKTFVDNTTINATDPTWLFKNGTAVWGTNSTGELWLPHVYMPNQNNLTGPGLLGVNAMGRWDYGPWFFPPWTPLTHGQVLNPYYQPNQSLPNYAPSEPKFMPGTPDPSIVPEAFMDTPLVNGVVYPYLIVGQNATRFRILNAANDRSFNLQLYYAQTAGPYVSITGGNGTGATAAVTVNSTGSITSISVTNGGTGYTTNPNVTVFDAPRHTPAASPVAASAIIDPTTGAVTVINVGLTAGSGFSVPTICNSGQDPNLCTEVSMVPAIPPGSVGACNVAALPADYPTPDGRAGGWPDPNTRGPNMIQIGTEGGFLPAPYEIPNRPVGYDYNRRSITVLNVLEKALFLGPAERADVIANFSNVTGGSTLILYNDAPAPVPGFDTRYDYYTGDQNQVDTGGAPSTLPGYGPNTRTIMQIRVTGTGTPTPSNDLAVLNTSLPVAYAKYQDKPIVPQSDYNTAFNANYPTGAYANIADTTMTFAPAGSATKITMNMQPKAIQELFDFDYGRMNALLGVEVPLTNGVIQTTIPYTDIDSPTEIINNSIASSLIGTLGDGTQIWKITHNGVDTHAIHFHMFNVQLINRVGWDGVVKPPEANEIGWKDTVRMNPLEDVIVAMRPIKPNVPFDIPNSIRPLDVTAPLGSTGQFGASTNFSALDPQNNPVTVTNHLVNFGWEYVWHCHLLGHEENIMMRPIIFVVAPNAPSNLTNVTTGRKLSWTDNSTNEVSFTIQKSTSITGPWTNYATVRSTTGPATKGTYTYPITGGPKAYFRVLATNIVGDVTIYTAPAVGYPNVSSDSPPSNVVII